MKKLLLILVLISFSSGEPFNRAINFVLAHEGGYCHDGGWKSNFGISSQWYPKENMKAMTVKRATEIYYKDYWLRTGCDYMLDSNYALLTFDNAVLFGQPTARALGKDCSDIDVLLERRVALTVKIIQKDTVKLKYLESWIFRLLDLQKTINH